MPSAIVTGAAHGIGLAVSRRLSAAGYAVAAVDVDAETLAAAPLPEGTLRVEADLADDPAPWVERVVPEFGVPTVLVNNVAVMDGRSFLELPIDVVRRNVSTTLLGTWALSRAVVDRMIDAELPGSLVFTLSLHTERIRMCPDYSVCKAGLRMLVKELAWELGPHGIRVNGVSPGAVDTWSDWVPQPEEHARRSAETIPLGRLGRPDDIAEAVAYLVDSDRAGYITGADLVVDGGLSEFNWLHDLYGSAEDERRITRGKA